VTNEKPRTEIAPTLGDDEQADRVSSVGVGRYQMIAQLAASAWGPLWVARAAGGSESGRVVSIRRVGLRPPLEASLLRKLALAALAAKDVRGAPLAAVLDVVVTGSEVAVVSEYVEGELLRSLQRRSGLGNRPIAVPIVLRLMLDATRALIAARDGWRAATESEPSLRSAVHGGLTPDSLFIATYGEPVLFDVGVAGVALSRPELADHAELNPYRAPEHLMTSVADERSDVFTLGVLLWELLSNRPLFGSPRWHRFMSTSEEAAPSVAEEAARARHRVLEMPVPRLDAVVRGGASIQRDLATVVARALDKNPNERYRSLEALLNALSALGREPVATTEEVARAVTTIASTSLEARRLALASVTGQHKGLSEESTDSAHPTLPPGAPSEGTRVQLEEIASSPDALQLLDAKDPKPPPLPRRRKGGSVPDA
jgi:serine/threonine protein kinase